jgi:hypothetical protein
MFDVADLRVSPVLALSGEEVTISARVRNKSSRTAVYPANLWLNDTIEETRAVTIGAGETANVSFNVTKQPGDYRVRVERTLGEFSVSGQPAPTATPGPASPTEAPQPTSTPVPATAVPTRVVEPTSTPVPASPPPGVMASPTVVVAATGSPEPSATPPPTVAPQTPSATPTIALPTQPEEEGGIGVGAIIGIVAGIIVVLGAVISYMVVIQRRRV